MHEYKIYYKLNVKDIDLTNSSDFEEDDDIPTITISSPPSPQHRQQGEGDEGEEIQQQRQPTLQNMDTVDDIDEDEAFINELIALHPNDEDIIVEDIEAIDYNAIAASETIVNNDEVDGVRKIEN